MQRGVIIAKFPGPKPETPNWNFRIFEFDLEERATIANFHNPNP